MKVKTLTAIWLVTVSGETLQAVVSTWIMHRISVPSVGSARLVPPVID